MLLIDYYDYLQKDYSPPLEAFKDVIDRVYFGCRRRKRKCET